MADHRILFSTVLLILMSIANSFSANQANKDIKNYYSKSNIPQGLIEEISKDECKPNIIGVNVCKEARKIADNLAPLLPMKMSSQISLDKVMAIHNLLMLTVILGYDESHLKASAQQDNITMDDLIKKFKSTIAKNLCITKSPVLSFINLGGKVQYQYFFSDMIYFTSIEIDRNLCANFDV